MCEREPQDLREALEQIEPVLLVLCMRWDCWRASRTSDQPLRCCKD
jgi:hypothetical protein